MEFDYFWVLFQIRKQFPLNLTNLHRIELLSTSEPYVGLEFYNMSVNMCPNKNIQYHVFPHVKPENLYILLSKWKLSFSLSRAWRSWSVFIAFFSLSIPVLLVFLANAILDWLACVYKYACTSRSRKAATPLHQPEHLHDADWSREGCLLFLFLINILLPTRTNFISLPVRAIKLTGDAGL